MSDSRHFVAISLTFMVAAIPLSGCLGTSSSFPFSLRADATGTQCIASDVSDCSHVSRAEDGTLVINDVQIRSGIRSTSILVSEPISIVIRNTTIVGGEIAIQWLPGMNCPSCRLVIENSELSAYSVGIFQSGSVGDVSISNSTILVGGPASVIEQGGMHFVRGISLAGPSLLRLTDVEIESDQSEDSTAIEIGGTNSMDVYGQAVSVHGFETGIQGPVPSLGPGPIIIECGSVGINARGSVLEVDGVQIHGCSLVGFDVALPEKASLRNVTVSESRLGMRFVNPENVRISGFNLRSNHAGILMTGGLDRSINITHGCILDNERYGAMLNVSRLLVTDTKIAGNGWKDTPSSSNNGETTHGGLIMNMFDPSGSWIANDSSFEGNEPFALFHSGYAPVMDATDNWWGSSEGPNVVVSPFAPVPAGAGNQVVVGPVTVVPFLMDAPALCQS